MLLHFLKSGLELIDRFDSSTMSYQLLGMRKNPRLIRNLPDYPEQYGIRRYLESVLDLDVKKTKKHTSMLCVIDHMTYHNIYIV